MSASLPRRPLAAVDLGSNSFRLLLAEIDQSSAGPQLRILDQIKESVRLGAGLDKHFDLSDEARQRALQALGRFAERLEGLELEGFRAVATNTFRVAHNIGPFLKEASAVLGHPIEVVAGREEARLIYLGAAHGLPLDHQLRLVIDIGGGSTECIIGIDDQPKRRESLQIGCVSLTQQFFSSGKISRAILRKARLHCGERLAEHVHAFRRLGWQYVVGTSGTAKALLALVNANFGHTAITREGLEQLEQLCLSAGHVDALADLPGLRADRQPVIVGGLAAMQAVFDEFGIEAMGYCDSALREGILYDLLGRESGSDQREITISHLVERYRMDDSHGRQVAEVACALLAELKGSRTQVNVQLATEVSETGKSDEKAAVAAIRAGTAADDTGASQAGAGDATGLAAAADAAASGGLVDMGGRPLPCDAESLIWAARIREIGSFIAHDNAHRHGAYILANADLPGFSAMEQQELSMLVLGQSGKLKKVLAMEPTMAQWQMVLCLRLAVILQRRRDGRQTPITIRALPGGPEAGWVISLPAEWAEQHPLTDQSLRDEIQEWGRVGVFRDVSYVLVGGSPAVEEG